MSCCDIVGETKRLSFWRWESSGSGEKSRSRSFCVLCTLKDLDKIHLVGFVHLKLPRLPPHTHTSLPCSQRLLSPRVLTEVEYSLCKLYHHVHLSYYIEAFPRDLTPLQILSKTCLLSDIVFPTFVSLFHLLNPNMVPPPTKQNRQRAKLSSCKLLKKHRAGWEMYCIYLREKETPVPCASRPAAVRPGEHTFHCWPLRFNTGNVSLPSCAFMFWNMLACCHTVVLKSKPKWFSCNGNISINVYG